MDGAPVDGYPRGDGPPADRPPSDPSVYLALGVHDHQPVGNFDWVLREHFEKAYRPFLEVMEGHPAVPFSLHISGPLLLWLAEEEPAYLARLRTMVDSGRIELKAGGFYEPILAIIPEADAHEQLRRMRCFLQEELGALPRGVWPAERVWEPHLARLLADAGLEYAVLDDSHFMAAGVSPEHTYGYFVTEEQGRRFDLFPISKDLRYLIPFREPEETVGFLRGLAERWSEQRRGGALAPDAPPPVAVYDDDGEKFGGWPGTHAHVYDGRWLERFLTAIEDAAAEGWLGLVTLGAFRRRFPPLGRVYLPTASYAEMLEWAGGFFRNFLVRYDEANLLHKRMLYTGDRVRSRLAILGCAPGQAVGSTPCGAAVPHDPPPDPGEHGNRRADELHDALQAYDHVLRAQCNDAYWHGVFGGLYLPHLRDGVTRNLLRAEHLLGAAAGPPFETLDLDIDGHDEMVLRFGGLVVVVAPARGGTLLSVDHIPSGYALLNTLRRRREPEHEALRRLAEITDPPGGPATPGAAGGGREERSPEGTPPTRTIHDTIRMKEPGLERLLFEDRLPRTGFIDRFLPVGTSIGDSVDTILAGLLTAAIEDSGDFATGVYEAESLGDRHGLLLRRRGTVAGVAVSVRKLVTLEVGADPTAGSALRVDYRVSVDDPTAGPHVAGPTTPDVSGVYPRVRFGPEVTINLLAGWETDRYVLVDGHRPEAAALADAGAHVGARGIDLVDDHEGVTVRMSWLAHLTGSERGGATPLPGDAAGPRDTADDHAPATFFRYGVVTVSQSEDGFERIYQGTALLPTWELPLSPATVLQATVLLEVTRPRADGERGDTSTGLSDRDASRTSPAER